MGRGELVHIRRVNEDDLVRSRGLLGLTRAVSGGTKTLSQLAGWVVAVGYRYKSSTAQHSMEQYRIG